MNLSARATILGLTSLGLSVCPSALFAAEKAVLTGAVAPAQPVSFEVYLPNQHRDQLEKDLQALHDPSSAGVSHFLNEAELGS